MSKFQLLSCDVALGGDILNVVARHAYVPVTYPELIALKYIHGDGSITNIHDVGWVERDDDEEAKRLCEVYTHAVIREKLFPGAGRRLPYGDNRYKPVVAEKKAPLPPEERLPDNTVGVGVLDQGPGDYSGAGTETPSAYVPTADEMDESLLPVAPPVPAPVSRASRRAEAV